MVMMIAMTPSLKAARRSFPIALFPFAAVLRWSQQLIDPALSLEERERVRDVWSCRDTDVCRYHTQIGQRCKWLLGHKRTFGAPHAMCTPPPKADVERLF